MMKLPDLLPYLSPKDWESKALSEAVREAVSEAAAEMLTSAGDRITALELGADNPMLVRLSDELAEYHPWCYCAVTDADLPKADLPKTAAAIDAAIARLPDPVQQRIVKGRHPGIQASPVGSLTMRPDCNLYAADLRELFSREVNEVLAEVPANFLLARVRYGDTFRFDAINRFILERLMPQTVRRLDPDPLLRWVSQAGGGALPPAVNVPGSGRQAGCGDELETECAWSKPGFPLVLRAACLLHHETSQEWSSLDQRLTQVKAWFFGALPTSLNADVIYRTWEVFDMCLRGIPPVLVAGAMNMIDRRGNPQIGNVYRIYSETRRTIDWLVWESLVMRSVADARARRGGFLMALEDLRSRLHGVIALDHVQECIGYYLERSASGFRSNFDRDYAGVRDGAHRARVAAAKVKYYSAWSGIAHCAIQYYGA